jgi:hypothetical protein
MGTDAEKSPPKLSVKIRVIRGPTFFQQAARSLLKYWGIDALRRFLGGFEISSFLT